MKARRRPDTRSPTIRRPHTRPPTIRRIYLVVAIAVCWAVATFILIPNIADNATQSGTHSVENLPTSVPAGSRGGIRVPAGSRGAIRVPAGSRGAIRDRNASSTDSARVWLCGQVKDEVPYMVEWLEHYRHMGVERAIVVDDGSSDDVALLPALYEQRGVHNFLTIEPPPDWEQSVSTNDTLRKFRRRKNDSYKRCTEMAKRAGADWAIICDVDDFIYPKASLSTLASPSALAKALKEISEKDRQVDSLSIKIHNFGPTRVKEGHKSQIVCPCDSSECQELRYVGSSNQRAEAAGSHCRLTLENQKNVASEYYEPLEDPEMITRSHTFRARSRGGTGNQKCEPDKSLLSSVIPNGVKLSPSETNSAYFEAEYYTAKTIYHVGAWRRGGKPKCLQYGAHFCTRPTKRFRNTKVNDLLKGNHYMVRSFEESVRKTINTHRAGPVECFNFTQHYLTMEEDTTLHNLSYAYLSEHMKLFVDTK